MAHKLISSESVTEGHPDKLCDQISDAILDSILAQDPTARVACETVTTTGMVLVMGEISTECYTDIPAVVRETIARAGYTDPSYGFDAKSCAVISSIGEQSPDIAMGVDASEEYKSGDGDEADRVGAGDQGMMFGYACDETPELMPAPLSYAHSLTRRLAEMRKSGELPYLRPDGKAQVTVEYDEGGAPVRIASVVLSTQHSPDVDIETLRANIREKLIIPTLPADMLDADTNYYINPTGRFVLGGPAADSGLTGRKIIVDTYGGFSHHGGGAFSGKDPTKVDRSASYMARYAAKNIVAAGLAKKCEIGVAYAIGVARPVSVYVDSFSTGVLPDDKLAAIADRVFDFRPAEIIKTLDLRKPIYSRVAAYGHFGREDLGVSWERTDKVSELRKLAEIK
jgi:S-adenosylmethionine synthetase